MQSKNSQRAKLSVSRRQRSTPYTARIESLGVSDYSIVNHTILPKGFGRSVEEDYWHLREYVQLWDVSCQRQVELKGKDAAQLVQLMTPRDLDNAQIGQCLYAPLIDQHAAMLNDPIILKLKSDHFWLSIADADILLWAKGLAVGFNLDVQIDEPDVSPLAVQGPKSDDVMAIVFGDAVRAIGFFEFQMLDFHGHPLLVARTGYSKQGGFEIYLDDSSLGLTLWDALWDAGQAFNIAPGSPNLIERVEGGLLSYGNEMTRSNNPLECGLEKFCSFDTGAEYIGKKALMSIRNHGPQRIVRGVLFDGDKTPPCASTWQLTVGGQFAGVVTTAIWSPRLEQNVSLGMLEKRYWDDGHSVVVHCGDGSERHGVVSLLPLK